MAGAIWKLIPVLLLLAVVAGAAFVAYQVRSFAPSLRTNGALIGIQMYLYSQELANRGQKHLEKKHIVFNKDGGLKVGVRELRTEEYSDRTQSVLVKAWSLSTWPAYKSWLWPQEQGAAAPYVGRSLPPLLSRPTADPTSSAPAKKTR